MTPTGQPIKCFYPGNDFYLDDIPTSEQVEVNDIPKRYYHVSDITKELHTDKQNIYAMIRLAGLGELKANGYSLHRAEVDFIKKWFEMFMAGETLKGAYHKMREK